MFEKEMGKLFETIKKSKSILITATEREDGDSIAAELALKYIIGKKFAKDGKRVFIVNENKCPQRFRFLPGAESITSVSDLSEASFDLGIVCDCGEDRTGLVKPFFQSAKIKVKIDHHSFGNEGSYDIDLSSKDVASTTEIIFHFVGDRTWQFPLDQNLASLIYVGIICDTGSFQYDLTKPGTHIVAARLIETGFDFPSIAEKIHLARSYEMKKLLGFVLLQMKRAGHGKYLWSIMTKEMVEKSRAKRDDMGDIIDELCFVNGVEVSMLFVEDDENRIRISFRSKGKINVGEFARKLVSTGGGHPRASGCVMKGTMDEVISHVREKLDQELRLNGLIR